MNNTAARRVLTKGPSATTGSDGQFVCRLVNEGTYNLEAVSSDTQKAWLGNVQYAGESRQVGNMALKATGTLTGRVAAPEQPTVTDFEGVEVFIPGSSYAARADRAGNWTMSAVPEGRFDLVAIKEGLGRAATSDIAVVSGETARAGALGLSLNLPVISGLSAANGARETEVVISGAHFGASTWATVQVTLNDGLVPRVRRISNSEIRFTVPDDGRSGAVVVYVAGLVSNSWPFTVMDRLTLGREWATVVPGRPRQLRAWAWDTEGLRIDRPHVTWTLSGSAARVEDGLIAGQSTGTGSLAVQSGQLVATCSIAVEPQLGWFRTLTKEGGLSYRGALLRPYLLDALAPEGHMYGPTSLVMLPSGDLAIADSGNGLLRTLAPDGFLSTFSGLATNPWSAPGAHLSPTYGSA